MSRWASIACTLGAAALVSGCTLPYYWQAMNGQISLLRRARPIANVIDDPAALEELRATLRKVTEMRRFAVTALDLPDNASYTRYADLERSYAVWNVVATEPFSIDPIEWCFPFAGCVSYRGYFDRADAERFERRLIERGLDTYTGGSAAYSTLGYFKDPVLNTMLRGPEAEIAGTLFHELAHQKLYFKDATELSEGFATVIEEYGVRLWLGAHDQDEARAEYERRVARRSEVGSLIARQRQRLHDIFDAGLDEDDTRAAKAEAFARLRSEFGALRTSWGGVGDYDAWFEQATNNAALVAFATYRRFVPALSARLEDVGLAQFYADMAAIADLEPDEREAALESWGAQR